jgi:ABC-2 type transport system permease protein
VFVPLAMLLNAGLLIGLGLVLAPLAVLQPDVDRTVKIFLRLLFYLSPVIYGIGDVSSRLENRGSDLLWMADLLPLNPLAGIFDLYRVAFFPDSWAGWGPLAVSIAATGLALLAGALTFRRLEGRVLKEL